MQHAGNAAQPQIAIVGAGRIAQSLGRALGEGGWPVGAIAGRNPDRTRDAAAFVGGSAVALSIDDIGERFDRVIVAVSDDGIESVAERLAVAGMNRGCAVHTSGVKGPEALAALSARGVDVGCMHPLQTVPGREQGPSALRACYFALSGAAPAIEFAEKVALCIGAKTFRIDAAARPLYHCAAVFASNYVSGLLDAALALMEAAGVSREVARGALQPLFEAAARNSVCMDPVQALTGPILRGDVRTVQAHMHALAGVDRRIARVYAAMGEYVIDMASRRGLPQETAAGIAAVLNNEYA